MHLWIEDDGSYLSKTRARSRVAGYHYLSDNPTSSTNPPTRQPPLNGAISVPCQVMRTVLASAAEWEMAALFVNGQEAVPECITLAELGHPQGPTPIATEDNITAHGIANDSIKQKQSKALDMRFYWVCHRVRQGEFLVYYWRKGKSNLADYFTKHHPAKHHRRYLHMSTSNRYAILLGDTD